MRRIQERSIDSDPGRKVRRCAASDASLPAYTCHAQLSIIVEFIAGKVTQTIDRLIALYRPDSLVVGTRGVRGMMQAWGAAFGGAGMGSVSRYCLSHSPVPIIVVRPESNVRKTMEKRRNDPKRGTHFDEYVSLFLSGSAMQSSDADGRVFLVQLHTAPSEQHSSPPHHAHHHALIARSRLEHLSLHRWS